LTALSVLDTFCISGDAEALELYTPLKLETLKHQVLKQRLLSEWPECDEETLADTLEGITDLREMIAAVIRSALVDEALQVGLRTRVRGDASTAGEACGTRAKEATFGARGHE
jgi:hypothetical protein